jgi:hypothetical protein
VYLNDIGDKSRARSSGFTYSTTHNKPGESNTNWESLPTPDRFHYSGPAGTPEPPLFNMPIFREDDMGLRKSAESDPQRRDSAPIPIQTPPGAAGWLSRRLSEESIRTELCEGPVPDSPARPLTPKETVSHTVSDRAELIERLKRGESPTWIPNRHVCPGCPLALRFHG